MRARPLAFVLLAGFAASGCLAPGVDIAPAPGDFAFLQIQLQG
ncbi:MAG: hypothetical protein ABIP94_01585 [Planctomycetota bacterium]